MSQENNQKENQKEVDLSLDSVILPNASNIFDEQNWEFSDHIERCEYLILIFK